MKFLCVGERRSVTAIRRGWTWADGHLAARTLRQAMHGLGLSYGYHYVCTNILDDDGVWSTHTMNSIADMEAKGWKIVALGKEAARYLSAYEITHVTLVHPAARGAIRKRERYDAHVAAILQPLLETPHGA
jgi:hypothetical protein